MGRGLEVSRLRLRTVALFPIVVASAIAAVARLDAVRFFCFIFLRLVNSRNLLATMAVAVVQPEVKLFGCWSFDDIEVRITISFLSPWFSLLARCCCSSVCFFFFFSNPGSLRIEFF